MNNQQQHPQRHHPGHPSPVERFNEPTIIQVNVCTKNRRPLLACEAGHQLCRSIWQEAQFWRVGQYMIMPDHIHLFCAPGQFPPSSLRQWVEYWKSQIRTRELYEEKLSYVKMNPVRKELAQSAEEWPYQGELHSLAWF